MALLAAAAAVVSFRPLSGAQDQAVAVRDVPTCDHTSVVELLKGVVAGSALAVSHNIVLIDVLHVSEDRNSRTDKRSCIAAISTNFGSQEVSYTMEWTDSSGDTLRLRASARFLVA